ncbi:hypothetical protein D3C77_729760 [compost metagenome]
MPSPYSEELENTCTWTWPGRRSATSFWNINAPCPLGVVSAVMCENLITIGSAWAPSAQNRADAANRRVTRLKVSRAMGSSVL